MFTDKSVIKMVMKLKPFKGTNSVVESMRIRTHVFWEMLPTNGTALTDFDNVIPQTPPRGKKTCQGRPTVLRAPANVPEIIGAHNSTRCEPLCMAALSFVCPGIWIICSYIYSPWQVIRNPPALNKSVQLVRLRGDDCQGWQRAPVRDQPRPIVATTMPLSENLIWVPAIVVVRM